MAKKKIKKKLTMAEKVLACNINTSELVPKKVADALTEDNEVLTGMQDAGIAKKDKTESQLDCIERELNTLFKGLSLLNSRIDRIVAAICQSKNIKGM